MTEGLVPDDEPKDEGERLLLAHRVAMEADKVAEAEQIAMMFMAYVASKSDELKSEDLEHRMSAHAYEDSADWEAAEREYKAALVLAKKEGKHWNIWNSHSDLSRLYSLVGRDEQSFEEAQLALQTARLSDSEVILNMALESIASYYLAKRDFGGAKAAADEILDVCGQEKMFDLGKSRALVTHAMCCLAQGDLLACGSDLDSAWPILEPHTGGGFMAGYQSALASWWGTKARLLEKQKDFKGAAGAMRNAVTYSRNVSIAPQLKGPYKYASLARSLQQLGNCLLRVNNAEGAKAAFEESAQIRRAIGLSPLGD